MNPGQGSGGYRWFYDGKLIPTTKAKRIKAARSLTGTKPRSNPTKRRRKAATRRKRNPWVSAGRGGGSVWVEPTAAQKKKGKKTGAKEWSAQKRKVKRKLSKKKAAPKRAAPIKKRAAPKKKAATKKKQTKRATRPAAKRRKSVAKPKVGTKAWYKYIGAKGGRAAARKGGKKAKRKTTRRRGGWKAVARKRSSTRRYLRRKPRGPRVAHQYQRTTYKRGKRRRYDHRYIVSKNPGLKDITGLVKKVLPIYGGMIAARAIGGLVKTNIVDKYITGGTSPMISAANAKYAGMVAPGLTFLLSVFAGPAIFKGGGTAKQLLEGLQLGSLVATFDSALSAFLPAEAKSYLGLKGYDDMGVLGYGYGAYMADPTGYSLPPAPASLEPGMGLDVHEAMALDAYVADDGLGLNVEEALADSESDYMQRGGAGGSLSRTVFTY